jgi:hypothetical protein
MRLLQLDPVDGRKLGETVLDEIDPETRQPVHFDTREDPGMPVALPDILSCDGESIYMRSQAFDLDGRRRFFRNQYRNNDSRVNQGDLLKKMKQPERHLFSAAGFLDDAWFHRNYFAYANVQTYASGQFHMVRQFYPSGQIMVIDNHHVFTYARPALERSWLPRTVTDCKLMRTALKPELAPLKKEVARPAKWNQLQSFVSDWEQELPVYPRAMVKAADRLLVAGPPDPKTPNGEALYASWTGQSGGTLLAIAPETGKIQEELQLDSPPVWDGMAAAGGRVFISLMNGAVVCIHGDR